MYRFCQPSCASTGASLRRSCQRQDMQTAKCLRACAASWSPSRRKWCGRRSRAMMQTRMIMSWCTRSEAPSSDGTYSKHPIFSYHTSRMSISELVRSLSHTSPAALRRQAVQELAQHVQHCKARPDKQRRLAGQPGVIGGLSGLLQDPAAAVRQDAAAALANIAYGDFSNKCSVGQTAGVVSGLCRLLRDDAVGVRAEAARAVRVLVDGHAENQVVFGQQQGMLHGLVALTNDGDMVVKREAEKALDKLAKKHTLCRYG